MKERCWLVADIGGTNARFRLTDDQGWISPTLVLPTRQYATAELLVDAACSSLQISGERRDMLAGACFAVAGPRHGRGVVVTNAGIAMDEAQLAAQLACATLLVNDFYALAQGVPALKGNVAVGALARAEQNQSTRETCAVIGPGSGLGMSVLVPSPDGGWSVMPSEGGHADLAPGSMLEVEIWGALHASLGHVSWESVLSGPGLRNLYVAVCRVWGAAPEALDAADIAERAVAVSDPVCHQTFETFFALLGAAAGNLALTAVATGGVYVGGGIVPRYLEFAQSSGMRRRFDERGVLTDFVRAIPLYIVTDEDPGLVGARECLRKHDQSSRSNSE